MLIRIINKEQILNKEPQICHLPLWSITENKKVDAATVRAPTAALVMVSVGDSENRSC